MEKLSQKESVLLGYTLQRSFTNPTSSPRTPSRNSDIDFHDVFGGPPRRSSIHETRHSFTETLDSFAVKGEDEALASRNSPWSSLNEKPVFGGESVYGRRHPSDEFYDDIFKGDESSTSPRKHDCDLFSSNPGSRALSPVRPLPPSAEPFGSSSLPAPLSLPTRLAKGTDLPPFGSTTSSPYKHRDSASNGSHTNSPKFTLSRFSSISSQVQEDLKSDYNSSYRTGLLSSEFYLSSEEASSFRRSDNTSSGNNLTKELDSLENPIAGRQFPFHFSIYKWASKGVPLMMPLREGNGLRSKEKTTLRRSSSATERIVKEKNVRQSPTSTVHNIDFPPPFHGTASAYVFRAGDDKEENGLPPVIGIKDQSPSQSIQEKISALPSEDKSNRSTLEDVGYDTIKHQARENLRPRSLLENVLSEKAEKKMAPPTKEAQKHELKTFSSLLVVSDGEEEVTGKFSIGEDMVNSDKKSAITSHLSSSSNKQDREISPGNSKVEKASFPSSDMDSGHNIGRKKVGGKISEFVKLFNQEPTSKPQDVVDSENHGFRRKQKDTLKAETEATVDKINMDEKPELNNTDASIKVDNISQQSVDDHSAIKTASYIRSSTSEQDGSACSTSEQDGSASNTGGSKFTVPDMEEPFQEYFLIKELPQDYDDLRETDNGLEEFKVIDAKIRQWSNGKEGNIRSLLSTLQYVLWPESGWKPVPLVDIIEGNAVKRSYQKALLYLHPDKLQQKGASSDQKYIAAKVFDMLQEAWTHFNTFGAL